MSEETILYQPEYGKHHLTVIRKGTMQEYDLEGECLLGRTTGENRPDISVSSGVVSRRHGRFLSGPSGTFYCDEGSLNGTLLNGKKLDPGRPVPLSDGDVLRIHGAQDAACEMDVLLLYSEAESASKDWIFLSLDEVAEIVIGRTGDLALQEKSVSRKHAAVFYTDKGWALIDFNSTNGVYRNNVRIEEPV